MSGNKDNSKNKNQIRNIEISDDVKYQKDIDKLLDLFVGTNSDNEKTKVEPTGVEDSDEDFFTQEEIDKLLDNIKKPKDNIDDDNNLNDLLKKMDWE